MSRPPIQFFNRVTRQVETESVYGEKPLRFIYENPLGALALHALVKKAAFSKWYGRKMDSAGSAAQIQPFIETYGLNPEEFREPVSEFRSFNEFFHRKLKPEARPVDADPSVIVLPADGRHLAIPDLSQCRDFMVKGVRFDIAALLGDTGQATRYEKGAMLISRLCPTDYHRFHYPCDGLSGTPRLINGPLYSVSPIALIRRPGILWENKRYITRIRTDRLGEVAFLEIGATCVGSVVHTSRPGQVVRKGDEKGYFRFGGSCVITLFEAGRIQFDADLLEHSAEGREVYARMGDRAGHAC